MGLLLFLCLALVPLPHAFCQDDADMVTLSADVTRWHANDTVTASGNVRAAYRDYTVTADSAEADLKANVAVFTGNVKFSTKQHTVEGETLTLNLKTKEWSFDKASSRVELVAPPATGGGPLFIKSSALSGDENDLTVLGGTITTCDLEHPHYYFSAREIEIYPDSRIVARKVSLVGLDKRLFTLDSLVLPIRGLKHNLLPQIGSSAEEGLFLKTSYAYMASGKAQGFLRLDLMEKRGIGTGIEQAYDLSSGEGRASLYYLRDQQIGGDNITGRFQHRQNLGGVNVNLTADYRTNSYLYYPTTTSKNWQLDFAHAVPSGTTALNFRGSDLSGSGDYDTLSSSLRHTRQFSKTLTGLFSVDMRSYKATGMSAADRELDTSAEFRHRTDAYDLALLASKRTDLDNDDYAGDDFYSSLDRLPELRYETDSYRSGVQLLGLPARLALSLGKFHEEPAGVTNDRFLLQFDLLSRTFDLGGGSDLTINGGFRQAVYAEDMAQNVVRLGGVLTARHTDQMKTRLTYNYQRPEGYSPFRFDYTGKYSYIRALTDFQDSSRLRWTLSTGYAFDRKDYRWQDLALRLTAKPNSNYSFSVSTGYDINRSKWRILMNQIRVNLPERLALDVGTRYSIEEGRFDVIRSRLDWRVNDKWRLEGIAGWNGTSKAFEYRSFRVTRDLHCWEASLVYNDESGFRTDRSISFELRLKAFPTVDRFGIGQYGQPLDTTMGEYYY